MTLITPMTIMAVMGLIMIGYGFADLAEKNSVLNFFFGIPLTVGALLAHFLIRRILNHNTLHIWLLEFFLVASFLFAFYYIW